MKVQFIGATTHIDRHFTRFSKEALEDAADQTNGNRKPRFGIEHDSTVPPLGKVLKAWVEQREDGEYQLVEEAEIFEEYLQAQLSNDVVLLKQECETDKNPFAITVHEIEEMFVVIYDRVNFGDEENRQSFLAEIKKAEIDFAEKERSRKSAIPDPEIIIQLTELIIEFLLAKKVIDKVGDKIADAALSEFTKFYSLAKTTIIAAARYAIPKNRPITYIIETQGIPHIEFAARTNDPKLVLAALAQKTLEETLAQAVQLCELFKAEQIQFLLNSEGEWEFNYLLTETGAVIGTPKSFSRRDRRVNLMLSEINSHASEKEAKKSKKKRKSKRKKKKS